MITPLSTNQYNSYLTDSSNNISLSVKMTPKQPHVPQCNCSCQTHQQIELEIKRLDEMLSTECLNQPASPHAAIHHNFSAISLLSNSLTLDNGGANHHSHHHGKGDAAPVVTGADSMGSFYSLPSLSSSASFSCPSLTNLSGYNTASSSRTGLKLTSITSPLTTTTTMNTNAASNSKLVSQASNSSNDNANDNSATNTNNGNSYEKQDPKEDDDTIVVDKLSTLNLNLHNATSDKEKSQIIDEHQKSLESEKQGLNNNAENCHPSPPPHEASEKHNDDPQTSIQGSNTQIDQLSHAIQQEVVSTIDQGSIKDSSSSPHENANTDHEEHENEGNLMKCPHCNQVCYHLYELNRRLSFGLDQDSLAQTQNIATTTLSHDTPHSANPPTCSCSNTAVSSSSSSCESSDKTKPESAAIKTQQGDNNNTDDKNKNNETNVIGNSSVYPSNNLKQNKKSLYESINYLKSCNIYGEPPKREYTNEIPEIFLLASGRSYPEEEDDNKLSSSSSLEKPSDNINTNEQHDINNNNGDINQEPHDDENNDKQPPPSLTNNNNDKTSTTTKTTKKGVSPPSLTAKQLKLLNSQPPALPPHLELAFFSNNNNNSHHNNKSRKSSSASHHHPSSSTLIPTPPTSSSSSSSASSPLPYPHPPPPPPSGILGKSSSSSVYQSTTDITDLDDPDALKTTPNHVTLNHLATACIKQNSVLAAACTSRYKNKYITQILYRPIM